MFVTGTSSGSGKQDYSTVAYRASTGARLWAALYPGKWFLTVACSIAVSPDGRLVFVTGQSTRSGTTTDYSTVAYRAATGAKVWAARYNGPANRDDSATSVVVSPRGTIVFVTGFSQGATSGMDYATVAYRAATGTQRWVSRYNGPGNGYDYTSSLAVGPHGARVYVTGFSVGKTSGRDCTTVAYRTDTGKQVRAKR